MITVTWPVPGPIPEKLSPAFLWSRSWFLGIPRGTLPPLPLRRDDVDAMAKRVVR